MPNTHFHNMITQLCFDKFQTLPRSGKPKDNEWTILSCIILENEGKFEVVALGTGTKCIGSNMMSKSGDILNDSHAEVICRRAFLRYIYEHLLQKKSDVFVFHPEEKKFQLKENIKFHFFSSQVPCGDAAIFPKQDMDDFGDLVSPVQKSSKRRNSYDNGTRNKKIKLNENRDIFRTGAKCLQSDIIQDSRLEGANYHVTGVVRTKPGRGDPTLSVSCSDKLAKWYHLGIQGALLSILLKEPIYLSSFTVAGGTPFNEDAIFRALFNRLGKVNLSFPYHRSEILLGQSDLTFEHCKAQNKHPCPSSIAWFGVENVERQIEVAVDGRRQGVTKKQLKTAGALKICKKELFKNFMGVLKQFEINLEKENLEKLTYKEAKLTAKDYQNCWSSLKENFKIWTVKDNILLDFLTV